MGKQLEQTQAQLSSVSAELHAMQQLLQQQRERHSQALSVAAESTTQQLQQLEQQQAAQEARALQQAEQKLCGQLSEARQQLATVLQELEAERITSGQLHQNVQQLQNQFADARKWLACHLCCQCQVAAAH